MYIPKFLFALWEEPKLVAKILMKADNLEVKEILAPFICNNFYQNIISPYSIEENLLYVISLMLKEEIGNLNSINQVNKFLNKTPCGYLLGELRNKSDIQAYSKNITHSLIEEIEKTSPEKKINVNIIILTNDIKQMEIKLKKKKKDIDNLEDFIFLKNVDYSLNGDDDKNKVEINYFNTFKTENKKEIDLFNEKYVTDLTNKELINMLTKYENDQNMKEYITKYINESSKDTNIFSNEILIDKIYESNYSKILFSLYQIDFLKIIKIIDFFIESFINSIQLLPYSVKFICKIISIFIKKKFPKIKKFEENAFIGQFLFSILFIPIFKNPIKTYINHFIISTSTLSNLRIIFDVFSKLVLGKLYYTKENLNYTPFNWYFLEKMPKIFELYEGVTKIEFPKYIELLVNDKLPEDFKYDYFNENPDEIITHRSICFTLKDVICLRDNMFKIQKILFPEINQNKKIKNNVVINIEDNIDNINNNIIVNKNSNEKKIDKDDKNEKMIKLNKMLTKLNSDFYKNLLNKLNKKVTIPVPKKKKPIMPIPNHVVISGLLINPNYDYLFNVDNKKDHFYIKELKKIENEEDSKKNNIIRVKNYFSGLLYNCRKLNKLDFSSKSNTLEILKEIKLLLKTNEFVIDNTIPYEWYVNSLLDCLTKIPKELAENDFEKLYQELEDDINKSIEIVDFYMMSDCFGKIKYTKKSIDYYNQLMKLIIDIDLNEKVNDIIENKRMPIEMEFKFSEEEKKFQLLIPTLAEKQISDLFMGEINRNRRICLNIEQFIKYFPNLSKIQSLRGIDILKEIKNMNITNTIDDYINYISNYLNKDKTFTKEECKIVKEKINDYILTKLYDKIYPAFPSKVDLIIYKNCYQLSWVEPKHLIPNAKNNNYDIFMDDIKQSFNEFEKEKSPRKKLIIIKNIFQTISKIITFNGGGEEDIGADDNLAILLYIFIKVRPKKIFSDIEYLKLFIRDNSGTEDNQITHLITVCEGMKNIDHTHLFEISEEEYKKNCESVIEKK